MNPKTCSVLFCALLASTFVHELRAKGVVPVNPSRLTAKSELIERVERSTSPIVAEASITLEVSGSVVIVTNTTEESALCIDVTNSIILMVNGKSSYAVCIDKSNNKGSVISHGFWNASSGPSLKEVLSSLEGGIAGILGSAEAVKFTLDALPESVQIKIAETVVFLVVSSIDTEIDVNYPQALNIGTSIADQLVKLLAGGGSLEGLIDVVGDQQISLTNDLAGLLNLLQGLGSVIEKVAGNVKSAIQKGVKLDLETILGAANGLENLANVILQLGEKLDLSVLADELGDVHNFLALVAKLGGNKTKGITGAIKVASTIVAYIKKIVTLDQAISCIIQYVSDSNAFDTIDYSTQLNSSLHDLSDALEKVKATETLSGLLIIVNDLINENLKVDELNLSEIISKLIVDVSKANAPWLQIVVEILLKLSGVVDTSDSISTLLLVMICKMNSHPGLEQLTQLGISFPSGLENIKGSILKSILSGVPNLIQLFHDDYLPELPVIKVIVMNLSPALEKASNGELNLKDLLNKSKTVPDLIKGLFQLVTGLNLGVDPAIVEKVKVILKSATSIDFLISVTITYIVEDSSATESTVTEPTTTELTTTELTTTEPTSTELTTTEHTTTEHTTT